MKNVMKFIPILLLAVGVFLSCNQEDKQDPIVKQKRIKYEVVLLSHTSEQGVPMVLKAVYKDSNGKQVQVAMQRLPFRKELNNVPATFKPTFRGNLFSIASTSVNARCTLQEIDEATGKVIRNEERNIKFTKDAGTYITNEEFEKEVSFSFE